MRTSRGAKTDHARTARGYVRLPQPRPRCEHTTEEGYLESYGFGYAIVFGLIILFLNGLLGILLALIGMVSPWLLCGAYVLLGAWFGGS